MDRRQFVLGSAAGVVTASTPASAEKPTMLNTAIDRYALEKQFNGTVLVSRRGVIAYHRSFGLANRAFAVKVRNTTRYRIASITKAFTSVMTLQLLDAGKLSLESVMGQYLPSYGGEGRGKVTVRQLLNHTSGLANFDTVTSYEQAVRDGMPYYQLPQTSDSLMNRFASGKLVSTPGAKFSYNNGDYIILGKIIEAIEKASYEDVLKRTILKPLGLKNTGMLHHADIIPELAPTYWKDGDKALINDMPAYAENWFAAGALYSTTDDLLHFTRALFANKLIHSSSLKLMLTPTLDEYGLGVWVADLKVGSKSHQFMQRPGSIAGANTTLLHFPVDDLTVIILANTNQTDLDAFSFNIARTALA